MSQKRVAIACQGGGSQCAFVAGALKGLFDHNVQQQFAIVALSGTSGGAFTAALAWAGLLQQAHGDTTPIQDGIVACWRDLTAQTAAEIAFDQASIKLLRLVEGGRLPSVARSPSSPQFRFWAGALSRTIDRPEFTDLGALLRKHLDFGRLATLAGPDSPALLVGAVDILEGSFKIFSSLRGEVDVDALLASAAIPNLFPAVTVRGHTYWDGIFASNPPVVGFMQERLVGRGRLPEEIWVIQVNPSSYAFVPERPDEIFDRRNHLAGNLALHHELQTVELLNLLVQHDGLTRDVRHRFGFDAEEPIKVRFIRMSPELQKGLDYASKLSRQPDHIGALLADGESRAGAFLASILEEQERSPDRRGGEASAEIH